MSEEQKQEAYRVLARKYRPRSFEELKGQEALVRTLKNAIESGRIAHAFMLTGVRGVGKTTTARIIAKALNYAGPDGSAGPTTGSTEDCPICQAITEDRHPDVMEMDAASRTGVDDIREILDGVRYAPTSARYKVYIIDEVHMLSKAAFNALLKTLEEPPEHVKFIFATTEIRKVPVTVLSRCQRFDLKRIDVQVLGDHFKDLCGKEDAEFEEEAISMIARAADGSARDGLSLLDQAIALGSGKVTQDQVQDMLGLADRARILDLFECSMTSKALEALDVMNDLYRAGADPVVLIQDLLDVAHLMTKLKVSPDMQGTEANMAEDQRKRASELAGQLGMATIGRSWQILLKGLQDVQSAPNAQSAAEMVIIRLIYAADLPDPATIVKRIKDLPTSSYAAPHVSSGVAANTAVGASVAAQSQQSVSDYNGGGSGAPVASLALAEKLEDKPYEVGEIETLDDVVALLNHHKETVLAYEIYHHCHLVKMKKGRIEFRQAKQAMRNIANDLKILLPKLTGEQWVVMISSQAGDETLHARDEVIRAKQRAEVMAHPMVQNVITLFPGAEVKSIIRKDNEEELL